MSFSMFDIDCENADVGYPRQRRNGMADIFDGVDRIINEEPSIIRRQLHQRRNGMADIFEGIDILQHQQISVNLTEENNELTEEVNDFSQDVTTQCDATQSVTNVEDYEDISQFSEQYEDMMFEKEDNHDVFNNNDMNTQRISCDNQPDQLNSNNNSTHDTNESYTCNPLSDELQFDMMDVEMYPRDVFNKTNDNDDETMSEESIAAVRQRRHGLANILEPLTEADRCQLENIYNRSLTETQIVIHTFTL